MLNDLKEYESEVVSSKKSYDIAIKQVNDSEEAALASYLVPRPLGVRSESKLVDSLELFEDNQEDDDLSPKSCLERWFALMKPIPVDIITTLGASSDVVLIHSESLIVRLLIDPKYCLDFLKTPQSLRFIFFVENYLKTLETCGAKYRLLFFDCFLPLLEKIAPLLVTARRLLLLHCQMSQAIRFERFEDWTQPDYRSFVENSLPPLMLMDDFLDIELLRSPHQTDIQLELTKDTHTNAILSESPPDQRNQAVHDEGFSREVATDLYDSLSFSDLCLALQLALLNDGIKVAHLRDAQLKGRQLVTFAVEPQIMHPRLNKLKSQIDTALQSRLPSSSNEENMKELSRIRNLWNSFRLSSRHDDLKCVGLRDFLIALFLRKDTEANTNQTQDEKELVQFFAKACLRASQLCRVLPLGQRTFRGFDEESVRSWDPENLLTDLTVYFVQELGKYLDILVSPAGNTFIREQFKRPLAYLMDIPDLFDSRLLQIMLCCESNAYKRAKRKSESKPADVVWGNVCSHLPGLLIEEIELLLQEVGGLASTELSVYNCLDLPSVFNSSCNLVPRDADTSKHDIQPLEHYLLDELESSLPRVLLTKPTISSAARRPPEVLDRYPWPNVCGDIVAVDADYKAKRDYDMFIRNAENLSAKALHATRNKIHQRGAATENVHALSIAAPDAYGTVRVIDRDKHSWNDILRDADSKSLYALTRNLSKRGTSKQKRNDKEDRKMKPSGKAQAIRQKHEEEKEKKQIEADRARYQVFSANIDNLAVKNTNSPKEFTRSLLDYLIGSLRFTDELINFPYLTSFFQTLLQRITALKHVIKVITRLLRTSFVKQTEKSNLAQVEEYHSELSEFVCFVFYLSHSIFSEFKQSLDAESIKEIQRSFLLIGFTKSAEYVYRCWLKLQDKVEIKKLSSSTKQKAMKGNARKTEPSVPQAFSKEAMADEAYLDPTSVEPLECSVQPGCEILAQLRFMGPYMERSAKRMTDARVNFLVDPWQHRMLNIIDRRGSALICAPTGSGKTFLCFYAMQKTLKWDDESVIVYVCPSAALIQQVFFEVKARFRSKEYPMTSLSCLNSTMVEHFHQGDIFNAQILITLPTCFELLLMSPYCREWVSRLKYVILDEIHCITGNDTQSSALERVIQLIPCPFLAMSATIGNAESFCAWLAQTRRQHSTKESKPEESIDLVVCNERYADLSTSVFTAVDPITNLTKPSLYRLNPIACLSIEHLRSKTIPDLELIPGDALDAYNIISEVLIDFYVKGNILAKLLQSEQDAIWEFIECLHPEFYFKGCANISKKHFRLYSNNLLSALQSLVELNLVDKQMLALICSNLMAKSEVYYAQKAAKNYVWAMDQIRSCEEVANIKREAVSNIIKQLTPSDGSSSRTLSTAVTKTAQHCPKPKLQNVLNRKMSDDHLDIQNICSLIRCLKQHDLCPTLAFNLNRDVVTSLVDQLVESLIKAQYIKYYGNAEVKARTKACNKKRMDAYRAEMRLRREMEKLKGLSKKELEEQGISQEIVEQLSKDEPLPPRDIAEEYDSEFFFGDRYVYATKSDVIEGLISSLAYSKHAWNPNRKMLRDALRRGIGVYHDGMSRKERRTVLLLIRLRFLSIVFTTESLSLGINVPCRSTVFLGEHINLTTTLFKQAAGRAGRRGYDLMGHTIFWNISLKCVRRLLCSPLPHLTGQLQVTPTLVLRTLETLNAVRQQHTDRLRSMRFDNRSGPYTEMKLACTIDLLNLRGGMARIFKSPLYGVATAKDSANNKLSKVHHFICTAFRVCAALLQHLDLIDESGSCSGLAKFLAWMHRAEPGNLSLVYLIMTQAFFEVGGFSDNDAEEMLRNVSDTPSEHCFQRAPQITSKEERTRHFIQILSYCFGLFPVSYNAVIRMEIQKKFDPLLPQSHHSIYNALKKLDADILKMGIDYVRYAQEFCNPQLQFTLPMSGLSFDKKNHLQHQDCPVLSDLLSMISTSRTRSPFASIHGKDDADFTSVEELILSKHPEIPLDHSLLPQITNRYALINGKQRLLYSNYIQAFSELPNFRSMVEHTTVPAFLLYRQIDHFVLQTKHLLMYLKSIPQSAYKNNHFGNIIEVVSDVDEFFAKRSTYISS